MASPEASPEIQVFDQISNRPSYWEPEGRWLCRLYFDPEHQRVAMVRIWKKTQAPQSVRFFSLADKGMSFDEFRQEWTCPIDGCQWKRRAPITDDHLALMLEGRDCNVPVWNMPSPQFARALAQRGQGLLGDYFAGERQSYGCHCEDTRCTSRGHWEEPFYTSSESPLVDWLIAEPAGEAFAGATLMPRYPGAQRMVDGVRISLGK